METGAEARPTAEPLRMPCPMDRVSHRRRNKLCLRIILVGVLNLLLYTLTYAAIGGDAHNGERRIERSLDGSTRAVYLVRGHFIHTLEGRTREVPRALWIYSYVHSILLLITSAGMVLAMLVLSRPHIIATMRDGWISGATFTTAFGTLVTLITLVVVFVFIWNMSVALSQGG